MGDDSNGECGVVLNARFRAPQLPGSNNVFWYSFEYQSVHVSVVTAEASLAPGSMQYNWLAQDLASVDRKATPWLFVAVHRPLYNSENDPSDYTVSLNLRAELDGLLFNNSVDVLVAGHYHSYQRTAPVYNNITRGDESNLGATVHITVGTAGIGFDEPEFYPRLWSRVTYYNVYAYSQWNVINSTDLTMTLFDSNNGTVLDFVHLHSEHNFPAM
jgi:hypothetical protein